VGNHYNVGAIGVSSLRLFGSETISIITKGKTSAIESATERVTAKVLNAISATCRVNDKTQGFGRGAL